jgi:excisionase family DNA binding protein
MVTYEYDTLTLRAVAHGLLPAWFLMEQRLLTARGVADQLGVGPATVLRWTRQGVLLGFRLPSGAMRYREDDVDAWLESRASLGRNEAKEGSCRASSGAK